LLIKGVIKGVTITSLINGKTTVKAYIMIVEQIYQATTKIDTSTITLLM